jgi:hypothetical protein
LRFSRHRTVPKIGGSFCGVTIPKRLWFAFGSQYNVFERLPITEFLSVYLMGTWKRSDQQATRFLVKESFEYETRTQRSVALRQEIAILWLLRKERGIVRMVGLDQMSYRIFVEPHQRGQVPVQLDQFLARFALDRQLLATFTGDLGCGLRALHRAGVVHMDLSTKSVLVRKDQHHQYRAVISNLSACRILPEAAVLRREIVSAAVPDPLRWRLWNVYFQAPELFRLRAYGPSDATKPSNVFAFGVLMHALMTRRNPKPSEYSPVFRMTAMSND